MMVTETAAGSQAPRFDEALAVATRAQHRLRLVHGTMQRAAGLGADDTSPERVLADLRLTAGATWGYDTHRADDALMTVAEALDSIADDCRWLAGHPYGQQAWNLAKAGGGELVALPAVAEMGRAA